MYYSAKPDGQNINFIYKDRAVYTDNWEILREKLGQGQRTCSLCVGVLITYITINTISDLHKFHS